MYAWRMATRDPIFILIFEVITRNFGIITGQDIFNPTFFIYFYKISYYTSFVIHMEPHKTSVIYIVQGKGKDHPRTGHECPEGD
jgi:hypothetical protein